MLRPNNSLLESAVERNPKALCLFHFGNINESDGTCYVKIAQFPFPIDFKFFLRQFVINDRRMPSARWERSLVNINPSRTPADMPIGPPEIHGIVGGIHNVKSEHEAVNKLVFIRKKYIFAAAPVFHVHPLDKLCSLNCGAIAHCLSSFGGLYSLDGNRYSCPEGDDYQYASQNIVGESQVFGSTPRLRLFLAVWMEIGSLIVSCVGSGIFVCAIIHHDNRRGWIGGILAIVGYLGFCASLLSLFIDRLPWEWRQWLYDGQDQSEKEIFHGGTIVLQKYLDKLYSCSTVISMTNVLSKDKQIAVVSALAEGSSIRSIERMTGVDRNTIMNLGVRVGKGCTALLDAKMRDLPCRYLQFDEVWGFIGKKERHCRPDDDPQYGDVWTFCAIDAETKLVPSFKCGKRNLATAKVFVEDVASRMRTRVQVSSDALRAYVDAIEQVYGADVDYGQIIKNYEHDDAQNAERKYSAARFVSVEKRSVTGSPDMDLVSTSYIERLNATTRLHMRRLTRLTLAFSKKFENFEAAVGLHFAYYNLVKRHGSLRMTPAMAAGIERDFWSVGDLVEATA